MRLHAEGMSRLGHEVTVLSGTPFSSNTETYAFAHLPELGAEFPLNLQVKESVDKGQTDLHFQQYSQLLCDLLKPAAIANDVIFTYGSLTTHFNLALTQALWKLADEHPVVAWVVDFTAVNSDYSLPCPDRAPWNMVRKAHPKVTYVAPSLSRRNEIVKVFGLIPQSVPVIPSPFSPATVFGLSPELDKWLEKHALLESDILFYCPARMLQRKRLDLAIEMVEAIRKDGISAALIATAAPTSQGNQMYGDYICTLIKQKGLEQAVFLASTENFWTEACWRGLFGVSDVLLFPSQYESFGNVLIEGFLHRVPVWHQGLDAFKDIGLGALVSTPEEALEAARSLLKQPFYQMRKRLVRDLNLKSVCEKQILSLLKEF